MFLIGHGISVRSDLPIPEWLFGWAAAMVLVVSFVALAVLWPEPRLQKPTWRPLPGGIGRVLASRPVEIVCGAIGVFLLGLTIYAGLKGTQSTTANFAPIFIYVIFWLGLVPVSVLFGDVFRAFNPWRAIGRGVAWVARTFSRGELPAPLEYPGWLGRWPAAAGIFCFATMELVASDGDKPESLAIAVARLLGAHLHRDGALRGRALDRPRRGVLGLLQPVLAPVGGRDAATREVGLRRPLSGLPQLEALPGTVAAGRGDDRLGLVRRLHRKRRPGTASPRTSRSSSRTWPLAEHALELTFMLGLIGAVLFVAGFYWLGVLGAKQRGRRLQRRAPGGRVRALAGADRACLRGRALLHAAALPGPGDRLPGRPIRSATAPTSSGRPTPRSTTA